MPLFGVSLDITGGVGAGVGCGVGDGLGFCVGAFDGD